MLWDCARAITSDQADGCGRAITNDQADGCVHPAWQCLYLLVERPKEQKGNKRVLFFSKVCPRVQGVCMRAKRFKSICSFIEKIQIDNFSNISMCQHAGRLQRALQNDSIGWVSYLVTSTEPSRVTKHQQNTHKTSTKHT